MSRAGRKRLITKRQPNGQPSRPKAVEERETKSVVIDQRIRIHARKPTDAEQPQSSTELGRLAQDGLLWPFKSSETARQNESLRLAGETWLNVRTAAVRCRMAPKPLSGGDFHRQGGYDDSDGTDPAYVADYNRTINIDTDLRRAIHSAAGWQGIVALELTVWGDYKPKKLNHLRDGLTAIRKFMDAGA